MDLDEIAERADLREGAEGVRSVLRAVHREGGRGVRPIARDADLPIPVAVAVVNELQDAGLVARGDGVRLTDAGRKLGQDLGLTSEPSTDPYPVEVPDGLDNALDAVRQAAERRGEADTTRDQAFATPETALRRALVLSAAGALGGRRVLFAGDMDLVSVACHAIGGAETLQVVDLDDRLAELLPGEVAFRRADLREGLPGDLAGGFDVVVTDPPYTPAGAELFLSRGVEGLEEGPGRTVLLSYARTDPDATVELQSRLQGLALAVRAVVPGFNRYEGAHVLGGRGDLWHLASTRRTAPTIDGPFDGEIYTGEVRPTRRRYRCTACREPVVVGEDPPTVEILKEQGCPSCGGDAFELVGRVRA